MGFGNIAGVFERAFTPQPLSEERQKKLGGQKISEADKRLILRVGTAQPGTNKRVRRSDIDATTALSTPGRFANISSRGGFTVLGKNALGQDIARDNATGRVGVTSGIIHAISPLAKSVGEASSARGASKSGESRRPGGQRGSGKVIGSTFTKKKNILGTEETLGAASILG